MVASVRKKPEYLKAPLAACSLSRVRTTSCGYVARIARNLEPAAMKKYSAALNDVILAVA